MPSLASTSTATERTENTHTHKIKVNKSLIQGLSLNLELVQSVRLANQQVPGIPLSASASRVLGKKGMGYHCVQRGVTVDQVLTIVRISSTSFSSKLPVKSLCRISSHSIEPSFLWGHKATALEGT